MKTIKINTQDGVEFSYKLINPNTQKAKSIVHRYDMSICHCVESFYDKPSQSKINAEQEILTRMNKSNGYDYAILGGNSSFYSCGWKVKANDGNIYLIYETHMSSYAIEYKSEVK